MMRRHAELCATTWGRGAARVPQARHVVPQGFAAGGEMRRSLGLVATLADLDRLLADLDPDGRSRSPSWAPAGSPGLPARPGGVPRAGSTTPTGAAATSRRGRQDHRRLNAGVCAGSPGDGNTPVPAPGIQAAPGRVVEWGVVVAVS